MNKISDSEIVEAWQFADMAYGGSFELSSLWGNMVTSFDVGEQGVGDLCHVINEGDRVCIVFAGSDDKIDWVNNLTVKTIGGLHAGFYEELIQMAPDVIKFVLSLGPAEILITGHSRGGALSDQLLELYGGLFNCKITCITFAQPKIATRNYYKRNGSVKDFSNIRYERQLIANDEVPRHPSGFFGFMHYGQSRVFGERLTWAKKLKLMWRNFYRTGEITSETISSHSREGYRKIIKGLQH